MSQQEFQWFEAEKEKVCLALGHEWRYLYGGEYFCARCRRRQVLPLEF